MLWVLFSGALVALVQGLEGDPRGELSEPGSVNAGDDRDVALPLVNDDRESDREVLLSRKSNPTASRTGRVPEGQDVPQLRITGRVVTERNEPLRGVFLFACPETARPEVGVHLEVAEDLTDRTDEQGRYEIQLPRDGVYSISIYPGDSVSRQTRERVSPGDVVDFVLPDLGGVLIRFVDPETGAELGVDPSFLQSGHAVYSDIEGNDLRERAWRTTSGQSTGNTIQWRRSGSEHYLPVKPLRISDGLELELPLGPIDLAFVFQDYVTQEFERVPVYGRPDPTLDVPLDPGCTVTLRFEEPLKGLAGARVSLIQQGHEDHRSRVEGIGRRSLRVPRNGSLKIRGLPPGRHFLRNEAETPFHEGEGFVFEPDTFVLSESNQTVRVRWRR